MYDTYERHLGGCRERVWVHRGAGMGVRKDSVGRREVRDRRAQGSRESELEVTVKVSAPRNSQKARDLAARPQPQDVATGSESIG